MMSASEWGVMEKADVVREVAWLLYYKSVPNVDEGRGSKHLKILGTSYLEDPFWQKTVSVDPCFE